MSNKLQEQLREAELDFEKLVEDSPEAQAKKKIDKLKRKIAKEERKNLVNRIKAKQSAISKALKSGDIMKEDRQVKMDVIGELDEEIKTNLHLQRDLGAESALLTIELRNFDSPLRFREKKLDTLGIYEEVVE